MNKSFGSNGKIISWQTLCFVAGATLLLFELRRCTQKELPDLAVLSDSINRRCPVRVDSATRLDSTNVQPQHRLLRFYYTLLNADRSSFDTAALSANLRFNAGNEFRNNSVKRMLARKHINIGLAYYDSLGQYLYGTTINAGDPQQK